MRQRIILGLLLGLAAAGCARTTQTRPAQAKVPNGQGRTAPQGHVVAAGGWQPDKPALAAPKEIDSESEEGFHDFVFYVKSFNPGPQGTVITATGLYKRQDVGFKLVLASKWNALPRDKDTLELHLKSGQALIESEGPVSDGFLNAMSAMYGVPSHSKTMAKRIPLDAVSLEGDLENLQAGPAATKMFYQPADGKLYAEFFINVDLKKKRLELSEKDIDYRKDMVAAFGGGG
jgi:hypothetical protein